ncbi:MAG: PVC-type heme-binding CxxCH protein [Planctomycetota bacterium]
MNSKTLVALLHSILLAFTAVAGDPPDASVFGEGVRPTEWLSPSQELDSFHVHPDFEVRLFASEPQIAKPLNLAPDKNGRLWVTCTVEYPYPAEASESARDFVVVLEDTNEDGAADKVTRFADRLNIPMGVLPFGDGCICFSIPDLLYLRDTDGDGVCDKRERILGPFDTSRDTHGMINALRDGGDGWIYACHGFNNRSEVSGSDGHTVQMDSGNTFRFRSDGSRVERFTRGQVNPFGMTEDEWGYRYTADCHSKPISQLIRGACYPSFSRPHDGLGFLPPMMDHLHGSTAISGIQYVPRDSPMESIRGQFISGNVMTSRINRNQLIFQGATARAKPIDDFLISDDPWFRPVDIRLASDGHLYVADFYNKIIGHYEVPLDHPGRDRTSGRIWQIRYIGDAKAPERSSDPDHPSDQETIQAVSDIAQSGRLQPLDLKILLEDGSPRLHVKALRLLPTLSKRPPALMETLRASLDHSNPHVRQAAVECLGQIGSSDDVPKLLSVLPLIDSRDAVLRQTVRIAVRDLMNRSSNDAEVWNQPITSEFASILLGLTDRRSASAVLRYLQGYPDVENRQVLLAHAAQYSDATMLEQVVQVARHLTAEQPDLAYELLDAICTAQNVRPGKAPVALRAWSIELVRQDLDHVDPERRLIDWSAVDGDWSEETRQTTGDGEQSLTSSLSRGESYTGRLVSDAFPAPNRIRFYLAGHNGYPDQTDHRKNSIQLVDDQTGQVIERATPPRNDRAVLIDWDTSRMVDRRVRIECVDGDSAGAYAWIAFGDFEPEWLNPSAANSTLRRSIDWVRRLGLAETSNALQSMATNTNFSGRVRCQIAGTLAELRGDPEAAVVFKSLRSGKTPEDLINRGIEAFNETDSKSWEQVVQSLCKRFSAADQRAFAMSWIAEGASMDRLMDWMESGWISPRVLLDPDVRQTLQPRLMQTQLQRSAKLTAGLELDRDRLATLEHLQRHVRLDGADAVRGKQLYKQHCAACHQLRGEGAVVGPQLDGAATRSVARLLEDIVVPDRNVDRAFRTTSFLMDDGRVFVGLVTHEADQEITFVESNGKTTKIDSAAVERRKESGRSLMPSNMAELLKADDLADLLKYIRG